MKKEKKLGRPRNTDMLPIPKGAMKQIKAVAEEARIPVAQVFEDVIENGLLTVREMYSSLINFRKARKELYEPQPDEPMVEEQQIDDEEFKFASGTGADEPGNGLPDEFRGTEEPEAGHSDDTLGPGLGENGEVTHVFDEGSV